MFLPATYLIAFVWSAGAPAAWIGGLFYVILLAALTVSRLQSRAWESKRV